MMKSYTYIYKSMIFFEEKLTYIRTIIELYILDLFRNIFLYIIRNYEHHYAWTIKDNYDIDSNTSIYHEDFIIIMI